MTAPNPSVLVPFGAPCGEIAHLPHEEPPLSPQLAGVQPPGTSAVQRLAAEGGLSAWGKAGRKKLPAEQGQLIEFEREEGVLEIEAPLLKLIVKCTDDSNNRSRSPALLNPAQINRFASGSAP